MTFISVSKKFIADRNGPAYFVNLIATGVGGLIKNHCNALSYTVALIIRRSTVFGKRTLLSREKIIYPFAARCRSRAFIFSFIAKIRNTAYHNS